MKNTLRIRAWLYVLLAYLSCTYVLAYSELQWTKNRPTGRHLIVIAEILLEIQWYALIVPLVASIMMIYFARLNRRILIVLPDILTAFSIGWVLLSIFVWQMQQPPVAAYRGLE